MPAASAPVWSVAVPASLRGLGLSGQSYLAGRLRALLTGGTDLAVAARQLAEHGLSVAERDLGGYLLRSFELGRSYRLVVDDLRQVFHPALVAVLRGAHRSEQQARALDAFIRYAQHQERTLTTYSRFPSLRRDGVLLLLFLIATAHYVSTFRVINLPELAKMYHFMSGESEHVPDFFSPLLITFGLLALFSTVRAWFPRPGVAEESRLWLFGVGAALEAGLPALEAFHLAAEAAPSVWSRKLSDELSRRLASGVPLGKVLLEVPALRALAPLLAPEALTRTTDLGRLLLRVADPGYGATLPVAGLEPQRTPSSSTQAQVGGEDLSAEPLAASVAEPPAPAPEATTTTEPDTAAEPPPAEEAAPEPHTETPPAPEVEP